MAVSNYETSRTRQTLKKMMMERNGPEAVMNTRLQLTSPVIWFYVYTKINFIVWRLHNHKFSTCYNMRLIDRSPKSLSIALHIEHKHQYQLVLSLRSVFLLPSPTVHIWNLIGDLIMKCKEEEKKRLLSNDAKALKKLIGLTYNV